MADEISLATMTSNGGRIAKILAAMVHVNLYDGQAGLRDLMEFRPLTGPSGTLNTTKLTLGYAAAAASSETSGGASNTLLSTGSFDLSPSRYLLVMQPTDLFGITGRGAPATYETVTAALIGAVDQTLANLLTGLFSGVSGNVGTSCVNLSANDFFSGIYTLNLANNPQQISAVLHNVQINDLIESMRGEGGAIQFREDVQAMFKNPGVSFRGDMLGVKIYQSDKVRLANANADRQGCMFSQGAFAYTLGDIDALLASDAINPQDVIMRSPEMFIERNRDAANGMTSLILNMYPGVAEAEDARAVKVTTDA